MGILRSASNILEGHQGLGAALSEGLEEQWAVLETSLKWHASCRHTHPAADAFQEVIANEALTSQGIEHVTARVDRAAIDALEPTRVALTIHLSKFSMPFMLAMIAIKGSAAITDLTEANRVGFHIRELMDRFEMVEDDEVEAAYSERWLGLVEVTTLGRSALFRSDRCAPGRSRKFSVPCGHSPKGREIGGIWWSDRQ